MVRRWNELIGYLVQPRRIIPLIVILLGGGDNGKTVLIRTVVRLLGNQLVHAQRVGGPRQEPVRDGQPVRQAPVRGRRRSGRSPAAGRSVENYQRGQRGYRRIEVPALLQLCRSNGAALDERSPATGVIRHRTALLLEQHHDVQTILRHVDSAKREHLRIPSLLMRARAHATVRVWKKRLELQAHSRTQVRSDCGLPVATGAVP
jgi:hypothetical protein